MSLSRKRVPASARPAKINEENDALAPLSGEPRVGEVRDDQPRIHFDCEKCPAFCCSAYERVGVSARDVKRLAKHFNLSVEETTKRFTKMWGKERVLKRKGDPLLDETCQFLDLKTRGCTVYKARPEACRSYPQRSRCAYYDLYKFEMRHQGDKTVVPIIRIEFREWDQARHEEELES